MNNNTIKIINENVEGRDFVMGDLHGCFDELKLLLVHVNFDPKRDRLFVTGDLIDRGPKSIDCLNLLNQKWFYSIYGNHEAILLEKIEMLEKGQILTFKQEELEFLSKAKKFKEKIQILPYVYEVKHLIWEKFYVLHAELLPEHIYPTIQKFDDNEYLNYLEKFKFFDYSQEIYNFFENIKQKDMNDNLKQKIIWSRKLVSSFYKKYKIQIENSDFSFLNDMKIHQNLKIFSGHNVVPFPIKIGQQYYIDTGAALGYLNKENNSSILFNQFGHKFFALSMVDVTTGICYGCITTQENRGNILKLENSIYNFYE